MSPEQISSKYYDYKIDVWGIACILFYLIFNKYPFQGSSLSHLKYNINKQNPFLNSKSKYNLLQDSFSFYTILDEMLHKNKHKRTDLKLFLDNNQQLLKFYNIDYNINKFTHYTIKFVPNSIQEWKDLIHKIKTDFNLEQYSQYNHNDSNNQYNNNHVSKLNTTIPKIISFKEIKQKKYNIPSTPPPPPPKTIKLQKIKQPNIYHKKNIAHPDVYNNFNYNKSKSKINLPKIYIHHKNKLPNSTIHQFNIQKSIQDRQLRIKKQQEYIHISRKNAISRIHQYKKKTPTTHLTIHITS